MAQPAFKIDVLQIEPGAAGTRTVSRDSTTGGLLFTDPSNPTGILLANLANLSQVSGVSVVGTSGPGCQYTSIQEAVDAAPDTATASAPHVLLVAPGTYEEDVVVQKDGIVVCALGSVRVVNASAGPAITVTQGADTSPRFFQLVGVTVECTEAGEACVLVDGSNTRASAMVEVASAPLAAGDVLVVGGISLTGVAGPRTAGGDNFDASLNTPEALAAEIVAALSDEDGSFASMIEASADDELITITSVAPGVVGNSITLTATTTPSGGLVPSASSLSGGGGAGSVVGEDGIQLIDCTLVASGVGSRQVDASYACSSSIVGGSWFGSSSSSESFFTQVGSVSVERVSWVNDLQVAFDSSEDLPSTGDGEVVLSSLSRCGDVITNLWGSGSVRMTNCPLVGDLTINGDRAYAVSYCAVGEVLAEDTSQVELVYVRRGELAGVGTPVVSEREVSLYSDLVASTSDTVAFVHSAPDADYAVYCDVPQAGVVASVTSRSASGFSAEFSSAVTGRVRYFIRRSG